MDILHSIASIREYLKNQGLEIISRNDEFSVDAGQAALIGRADLPVKGFRTIRIDEFKDCRTISNYALMITFSNNRMEIGPAQLTINGEDYKGANEVKVVDTRGNVISVDDKYNAGAGLNVAKVMVNGDNGNGFTLEMIGQNRFKLSEVKSIEDPDPEK